MKIYTSNPQVKTEVNTRVAFVRAFALELLPLVFEVAKALPEGLRFLLKEMVTELAAVFPDRRDDAHSVAGAYFLDFFVMPAVKNPVLSRLTTQPFSAEGTVGAELIMQVLSRLVGGGPKYREKWLVDLNSQFVTQRSFSVTALSDILTLDFPLEALQVVDALSEHGRLEALHQLPVRDLAYLRWMFSYPAALDHVCLAATDPLRAMVLSRGGLLSEPRDRAECAAYEAAGGELGAGATRALNLKLGLKHMHDASVGMRVCVNCATALPEAIAPSSALPWAESTPAHVERLDAAREALCDILQVRLPWGAVFLRGADAEGQEGWARGCAGSFTRIAHSLSAHSPHQSPSLCDDARCTGRGHCARERLLRARAHCRHVHRPGRRAHHSAVQGRL